MAELAAIERLLAASASATDLGAAGAVFLTGEPGIGKTSVLAELARLASTRGFLVLDGSAAEFEQGFPSAW